MATFQYEAHNADQTPVEGQIDADDLKSALLSLENQGFVVSSIQQLTVGQDETDAPWTAPSPAHSTEAELAALRRQFGRVLETGRPLAPALLAFAQELPRGRRRHRLQRISDQLEQGHDPSQELAAGQIDEEWIPLLSASVSSGDPSKMLSGIIDESQQAGNLRRQFAAALAYPLLLIALSLVLLSMFTWWITPTFRAIFVDFGMELPAATLLVLRVSETIRESRGLVILIPAFVLAAIIAFFVYGPRSGFRDRMLRRIPVFASVVRLSDKAKFTRCLADLMEAEVLVADALRIGGRNTGHAALREAANQLATEMEGDTNLRAPSSQQNLPHTVLHALQLKAEPRAAARILRELSWMYDQQSHNRLAWISSAIGPVFILYLGTVVGFYVIALFMPLISLIQNLA